MVLVVGSASVVKCSPLSRNIGKVNELMHNLMHVMTGGYRTIKKKKKLA